MIGDRIQQLRLEKKLSLTELSHRAGIAKSYISNIERDKQKNPSLHVIEKIAAVLEVDVQSLVRTESEPLETLDEEWAHFAQEAMSAGITKEHFHFLLEFFEFQKWKQEQQKLSDQK